MGSSRLKQVATALGVPVVALFGEDDNGVRKPADRLMTEFLSLPYAIRLLRAFGDVKDKKQRLAVVELVESIGPKTK
jgi:hypothetical protein